MANTKSKDKKAYLHLIGQKIGSIRCASFIRFGDAIVVMDENGNRELFSTKSIEERPAKFKIKGEKVDLFAFNADHTLFILSSGDKYYFRDRNNEKISGSDDWVDFYLEPYTSSFFRKDNRNNWYDIQGFQLKSHFFIKDQILCSIIGKTSKKSIYYKGQSLFVNPKSTMVQVGKVVYDTQLNVIDYFGEKITGLGNSNITFASSTSIQEVLLGLSKRAFINEDTLKPFTINGEEIISHTSTIKIGRYSFEIFRSKHNEYLICDDMDRILLYENNALSADFDSYITVGEKDLLKVRGGENQFYLDLESLNPYDPLNNGKLITQIDSNPIKKQNHLLFNMVSKDKNFVLDSKEERLFSIGDEKVYPEKINLVEGYEKFFFYATIEGTEKLCDNISNKVITVAEQSIEVSKILSSSDQKLINFIDTDNQRFVLDARYGMENLKLAKVDALRIVEALGNPTSLGNTILQNVVIQTLGGTKHRVINLNDPNLSIFHLPNDLRAYSEQADLSVFAGNAITKIDFENSIKIDQKYFFNATFISYLKEPKKVILQQDNARPLQLDGLGHRNELVQEFDISTIKKKYFLSEHRVIGVKSLTEDLKVNQLLFSFKTMSSWLPFYDTYLPIFKKIKDFESFQHWEYHLFEIHNISNVIEYIAVEQKKPYRILVDKVKSKYRPRIVKSKEIILKSPEEISSIRRFFSNPGYLVEVG